MAIYYSSSRNTTQQDVCNSPCGKLPSRRKCKCCQNLCSVSLPAGSVVSPTLEEDRVPPEQCSLPPPSPRAAVPDVLTQMRMRVDRVRPLDLPWGSLQGGGACLLFQAKYISLLLPIQETAAHSASAALMQIREDGSAAQLT